MKVGSAPRRQPHWKRRFAAVSVSVLLVSWLPVGTWEDRTLLVLPLEQHSKTLDQGSCIGFPSASLSRPKFFMEDGAGKEYLELFHNQSRGSSRRKRLLKVRFVLYDLATKQCRPLYYHIHKNGGSTMNIQSTDSLTGIGTVQAYYTPRENQLGRDRFENETMCILKEARDERKVMPVFTFVRDPVTRFLSSVGQALKLNQLGSCTKGTTRKDSLALLDCVLTRIQVTQQYLDEHLEPQIFELYHGMMGLDLRVHVMDMNAIDIVLQTILGLPVDHIQASRRKNKGSVVAGYNMSISILTPKLVERICSIYRMDVLFLQETNMTSLSTKCSAFLPSLV